MCREWCLWFADFELCVLGQVDELKREEVARGGEE